MKGGVLGDLCVFESKRRSFGVVIYLLLKEILEYLDFRLQSSTLAKAMSKGMPNQNLIISTDKISGSHSSNIFRIDILTSVSS